MNNKLKRLKRKCTGCSKQFAAYLTTTSGKIARADHCPKCKAPVELTVSQRRIVWKFFRLAQVIGRKIAEQTGIDEAAAEGHAHECLERFVRRYSFANGIKLTTYLTNFITVAVKRWSQPDGAGGITKRVVTNVDSTSKMHYCPETYKENFGTIIERKVDSCKPVDQIDAVDTLQLAKRAMTAEEWVRLETYSQTGEGHGTPEMLRLLVKARRLIQSGNNGHTKTGDEK